MTEWVPEASCVDVGDLVFAAGPGDGLQLLHVAHVPQLDLGFGGVAAHQDGVIFHIDGVACHVRAVEGSDTLGLPQIPQVDHRVPASRNHRVFVHKLDAEDAVRVA